MTPKEKAIELVDKYDRFLYKTNWGQSKRCALIAVDEILKVTYIYNDTQQEYSYFEQVKSEINKL